MEGEYADTFSGSMKVLYPEPGRTASGYGVGGRPRLFSAFYPPSTCPLRSNSALAGSPEEGVAIHPHCERMQNGMLVLLFPIRPI